MTDQKNKSGKNTSGNQNTDITNEIRLERKFSLSEAIARQSAGSLKGASPVALSEQLLLEIENILECNLIDLERSLQATMMAHLQDNLPLLARHFHDAKSALSEFIASTLSSETTLNNLVRDTDSRWGRQYLERPYFERDGIPADNADPYTRQGVRQQLVDLLATLR